MSKKNLIRGAILLLLSGAFLLVLADVFDRRLPHADATHCEAENGIKSFSAWASLRLARQPRGEMAAQKIFYLRMAYEARRKSAFHTPSSPRAIV
jgi:hypothetical protein